jgi:hypothetical protein
VTSDWRERGSILPGGGLPLREPSDRERARAAERERRAAERAEASHARSDRRAAERGESSRAREQAREKDQALDDARRAMLTAEREVRPKRRASGSLSKTGEKRVERDVSHYKTAVDSDRIRLLASRGASIDALTKVFGISSEEVEAALAGA